MNLPDGAVGGGVRPICHLIGRASEKLEHLSSDMQRTPSHFCPQSVFFCSLSTAVCFAVRLDG